MRADSGFFFMKFQVLEPESSLSSVIILQFSADQRFSKSLDRDEGKQAYQGGETMKAVYLAMLAAVVALCAVVYTGNVSADGAKPITYNVTVTSLTGGAAGFNHAGEPGGEYFAPVFMMTQNGRIRLFTPGQAPSVPLAKVAEAGNPTPLVVEYKGAQGVGDVVTTAPLAAGGTTSFTIQAPASFNYFSVAAMLFPTNDEFMGLSVARLPQPGQTLTYWVNAWDADAKVDDELCADMAPTPNATVFPVPECAGVNGSGYTGSVPATARVHIANGIHGNGDLPADVYDWRNPVAKITISNLAGSAHSGSN
jgi:hypothetical protein